MFTSFKAWLYRRQPDLGPALFIGFLALIAVLMWLETLRVSTFFCENDLCCSLWVAASDVREATHG
ncbi:hypothetical protein Rvan_0489 [Rhodomicrobium vannielii ATCC 17100]|uniref:Uncharacterized protein n=1 Tax=Rhodomicrobium vannielii (strain ATCC 17100 / DSM 162 / LMG 4299 / NCIMB 10020 / ATH 3.1.1) TaxID=648757 RepID=E3HYN0_RHOVT|nr:hypothetical protein [Rhodomicrobium vannielii]ADP69771.1 hypothetical protein Rvan_0489 [Rhodomicrobium vannielii ATCC 17100]